MVLMKAENVTRGDIVAGYGQVVNVEKIRDVFENKATGDIVGAEGVLIWFIDPRTGEDVHISLPGFADVEMFSTVEERYRNKK